MSNENHVIYNDLQEIGEIYLEVKKFNRHGYIYIYIDLYMLLFAHFVFLLTGQVERCKTYLIQSHDNQTFQ